MGSNASEQLYENRHVILQKTVRDFVRRYISITNVKDLSDIIKVPHRRAKRHTAFETQEHMNGTNVSQNTMKHVSNKTCHKHTAGGYITMAPKTKMGKTATS